MVCLEVIEIRNVDLIAISCRNYAGAVSLDHRGRSTGKIPQRIGEVRVVPFLEPFPGKVSVAIERDFAQQEIAEGIRSIAADSVAQIEIATGGFAHPGSTDEYGAVHANSFRHCDAGRHQRRWPDDG